MPSPVGFIQSHPTRESRSHTHLPTATSSPAHIVWTMRPQEAPQMAGKMPKPPGLQHKGGAQASLGKGIVTSCRCSWRWLLWGGRPLLLAASLPPALAHLLSKGVKSDLQKTREVIWKTPSGQPQMPAGLFGRLSTLPATSHLPSSQQHFQPPCHRDIRSALSQAAGAGGRWAET